MTRGIFVLACAAFVLSGCQSGQDDFSGHYEGTLLQKVSGSIQQAPVAADVSTPDSNGNSQIVLHDSSGKISLTVVIAGASSDGLSLAIPGIPQSPLTLVSDTDDGAGCYADAPEKVVFFCAQNGEITIGVNDSNLQPIFSLTLDKFNPQPLPTLEPPRALTLDQAVATAEQMSFANKIEFQHVIQARAQEDNAYLNLLPHLTANSVLSIVLMDTPSFLEVAANVAPFLFPSRWFQAGESAARSAAEEDTMILTRADTTLQVQTLVYNLLRNEEVLSGFDSALATGTQFQSILEARVAQGELPSSALDDADSAMIFLKENAQQLDDVMEQDKTSIAQTLGFYNPKAVTDVTLTSDYPPIETATPFDFNSLIQPVTDRSFELRQIDSLVGAAQLNEDEVPFDWLDPEADPSTSLGFGLGQEINDVQSQVQELLVDRQQIQSMIAQSVQALVDGQSSVVISLSDAEENIGVQKRRVATSLASVSNDKDVDVNGAYGVLQDQLSAIGTLADLRASYRTLQAKRDRLLLQGFYSTLASAPTPNPNPSPSSAASPGLP